MAPGRDIGIGVHTDEPKNAAIPEWDISHVRQCTSGEVQQVPGIRSSEDDGAPRPMIVVAGNRVILPVALIEADIVPQRWIDVKRC